MGFVFFADSDRKKNIREYKHQARCLRARVSKSFSGGKRSKNTEQRGSVAARFYFFLLK